MSIRRLIKNPWLLVFLFLLFCQTETFALQRGSKGVVLQPLSPLYSFTKTEFTDPEIILTPTPLIDGPYFIQKNSSIHQSLKEKGIEAGLIGKVIQAIRPALNFRQIQPGTQFTIFKNWNGNPEQITIVIDPLVRLKITQSPEGQWISELTKVKTTNEIIHFAGIIKDSLWNSAVEQKIPSEVIIEFSEVFGWQIDFSRQVQNGDQWRFSIEKVSARGHPVGWDNILYAEYKNQKKTHKAYLYKNGKIHGYFDEKGQPLRKLFLKSPIKFGRITSHFSHRRYHPIHRRYKPHNGVDYGAPRGTPVRTVGDGVVTKIGRYGGSGKMIVVNHQAGYQTKYLHLSGFKKGVRRGSRVSQGETIGYVGSTGYATGPHLHFEMSKYNRIMNPLRVNIPHYSEPIPKKALADFQKHIRHIDGNIASQFKENHKSL